MFESPQFVLFSDLRVLVLCFSIHLGKKAGVRFRYLFSNLVLGYIPTSSVVRYME